MSFTCPVPDQRFVLENVVRVSDLARSNRYSEATADTVDAVLQGAAAFAEGELAPLNAIGDRDGARWSDGQVSMPPGFQDAYCSFVEGGWMGLSAPVEAGGQGLPLSLSAAMMEDLNAANFAFALCPMLGLGAAFGQVDRGELGDRDSKLRADVLTPLVKAWCTDVGCEVASIGIQVHGGMGYVEETGAAQHLRDARIAPIYEGTNGIQAADFVQRKIGLDGGEALDALFADVRAEAEHEALIALADAIENLVATARNADVDDRLAGSYPLMTMTGVLTAGWLMERLGRAADSATADEASLSGGRRAAIDYFMSAIVPEALGLGAVAGVGAELLYAAPAEELG